MATETILQHWILTKFAFPFLLIFFIVFGILEKTNALGNNKQLNAFVSLVIGLIFVGAVFPKLVVENLILFLTVALVVLFVVLLIWSFATGGELKVGSKGLRWFIGIVAVIAVLIVVLYSSGLSWDFFDSLLGRLTTEFWTNLAFIIVIIIALALVVGKSGKKSE